MNDEKWCFSPLDYELRSPGGSPKSATDLLVTLIERMSREESRSDEAFWKLAAARHLQHAITAVWLAWGRCAMQELHAFLTSVPSSPPPKKGEQAEGAWAEGFFAETMMLLHGVPESRELELAVLYWLEEFPRLAQSEKTAAVVTTMAVQVVDQFVASPLASLVCGASNVTPDDVVHGGKVVLVDTPELVYQQPGRHLSIIWRMGMQRACLRRTFGPGCRPAVCWADEYQLYATEQDVRVQAVARSHGLISVVMFQTLPVLYSSLGGTEKAKREAEGIIANHVTRLVGSLGGCKESQEFWSGLFGQSRHLFFGGATDHTPYDPVTGFLLQDSPGNVTFHEQMLPDVLPGDFGRLARGGAAFDHWVEMYCHQSGRRFRSNGGKPWVKCAFKQRPLGKSTPAFPG